MLDHFRIADKPGVDRSGQHCATIYDWRMRRRESVIGLIAVFWVACAAARASDKGSALTDQKAERSSSMSQEAEMIDLFNRWEQVWHEGKFDLVPRCACGAKCSTERARTRSPEKGSNYLSRKAQNY
jgi:hypothetical protein